MKETDKLIKTLEGFYGNGPIGLASQVGYLTGVLKEIEYEYKSAGDILNSHSLWIKKELVKE